MLASTSRVGQRVKELREIRKMSRRRLIARTAGEFDPDDSEIETISEDWLKRLELERPARLTPAILEALCRALLCSPRERADLFLLAGFNILVSGDSTPGVAAQMINYVSARIYADAEEIIIDGINDRHLADLKEQEMFEIVATALELVIQRGRRH